MAPHADVSDGQLDVIRVGPLGRPRVLTTFPRIFRGTHVGRPGITERRARRVDFVDGVPRPVMVDGEIAILDLRSIEIVPGALRVIA
jgi:diacylglycerol kinase (ATP)